MAQPVNTYATNDTVGIREDLSDFIYMVEREETPFMSMVGKTKATNTTHEWQTDALAAANAANAHIEGDDTSAEASTPTTRLNNITQIFKKSARVSGTNSAVTSAGRADEMAYQVNKRTREIKRDMESAFLANTAKSAGSDVAARRVAGVPTWIATNTSAGAGGTDPAGTGAGARGDGTQRAFTEDLLLTVLQEGWTNGARPDCIMVGPFNKLRFAGFTGRSTAFEDSTSKKIINTVEYYVSPFDSKELKVLANNFQRARDVLILQSDMWAVSWLRTLKNETLAKMGDSEARQLIAECTIESRNEKASGIVADTTTA